MDKAKEGSVKISVAKGVFFNPQMELCRDLSSLCIGSLGGKRSCVDAACATGVRGLRYKKENKNISSLSLVDLSPSAIKCAKKNIAANKVKNAGAFRSDACLFLAQNGFDIVEVDPFGSPIQFLHDSARCLARRKSGHLSITATDMAVLCGAHHAACLKNYSAIPLDNEFCHENAVRILAGKVITAFSPFNIAAIPIFTLSHRHYVKMVFSTASSADAAVAAVKSLGFISYCPSCLLREKSRLVLKEKCPHCGHILQFAGPMYLGPLWDSALLEKMLKLNAKRKYGLKKENEKMISTMLAESAIHSIGYYDLHAFAKKHKGAILPMEEALGKIRKAGFAAARTHFCPTAIRTDAPHEKVLRLLKG